MSGAGLPPLKRRKLGRTNVSVTELGLGTAPLGELFVKVDDDEAAAVIDAARGVGIVVGESYNSGILATGAVPGASQRGNSSSSTSCSSRV